MGLYGLHLHLHGLFRSHDLELGRDSDTGGQTTYVLELARSMAAHPDVELVEVVTRLIHDRRLSSDYSEPLETLAPGAAIRRFSFGPRRYIRKEQLWPYLDELADSLVQSLLSQPRLPDWIHAHYADAGYVGVLLRRRLGIPLVFTGHSLGREKRRRLMASGLDPRQIDQQYAMALRIDAEELALAHAHLVVTSTEQELRQQYARYGRFRPDRARVIPPGVDLLHFFPPVQGADESAIEALMEPFLRDPDKPPVLAICRADHRKNIPALVEVFGRSDHLRQHHNLVLVLGCRDDPRQLEKAPREVFQQVFELVDRFDLYGQVAYPKQHERHQIPEIYRWAARRRGVFVNPALTEPFGLTLLEAAATGLPVVATDDGGPRDILQRCDNGLLVDVSDLDALQQAVEESLRHANRWQRWSRNGMDAVRRHFSWDAHVATYLDEARRSVREAAAGRPPLWFRIGAPVAEASSPPCRRLLVLDLDAGLAHPGEDSLEELRGRLARNPELGLALCSGRSLQSAADRYEELGLPSPLAWIIHTGTEIYLPCTQPPRSEPGDNPAPAYEEDLTWQRAISRGWDRPGVEAAMAELMPRLQLQPEADQGLFRVSYTLEEPDQGIIPVVRQTLRTHGQSARPHLIQHRYLDVLPLTATRSEAIRYLALRWNLSFNSILVVASQQGEAELLRGMPCGVVPLDHDPSLDVLRGHRRVFFAARPQVWGLIDGLEHHRFLKK